MPWVSIEEASRLLRVSARTVKRIIKNNVLKSRLQEGRRLVFVEQKKEETAGKPDFSALEHLLLLWEDFSELRTMSQHIYQCKLKAKENPANAEVWKSWVDTVKDDESKIETCVTKKEIPFSLSQDMYAHVLNMKTRLIIAARVHEVERKGYPSVKSLLSHLLEVLRALLVLSSGSDKPCAKESDTAKKD